MRHWNHDSLLWWPIRCQAYSADYIDNWNHTVGRVCVIRVAAGLTKENVSCWICFGVIYRIMSYCLTLRTMQMFHHGVLSHWGRVTHICVSKLTIIGPDNGLSAERRQAMKISYGKWWPFYLGLNVLNRQKLVCLFTDLFSLATK